VNNILTSISLERTVQSSLQLDADKSKKKRQKHTIDSVRAFVESFGYKLISTQYVSVLEKLDIACPLGHRYSVSYSSFQRGYRCAECAGLKKHTIDAVKQHIESFGYQLLSTTYVGANAKLDLVCPNQHMYRAAYGKFQQGNRCAECFYITQRRTMKNGGDWEPDLRTSKAYVAWKKAVKKRDDYTCQACFYPSKNLCAHHIESRSRNPDLQTELSNGITLCKSCHIEIHSLYGQTTATRSDLAEFTRLKCR